MFFFSSKNGKISHYFYTLLWSEYTYRHSGIIKCSSGDYLARELAIRKNYQETYTKDLFTQ